MFDTRLLPVVDAAGPPAPAPSRARTALVLGLLGVLAPVRAEAQSPDAPFPVPTYPEDARWDRPDAYEGPGQPATEVVTVDGRVQLFVDNHLIADSQNLRRELANPRKDDRNPVLTADKPWENGELAFPSVHFVGGRFHMWYLAVGNLWPSRLTDEVPIEDSSFLCYATSEDGIHWTKPSLGHVEFDGSKDNNIVLRHQGSHVDSFSVFHHPGRAHPYKMLLYQGTWPYKKELIEAKGYDFAINEHGHYPFRSKDGIRWEYVQEKPEPVWRFDRSNAAYDTERDLYIGLWKAGYNGVRSRKYAESKDLVHWSNARWLLIPQWLKDPESKVDPAGTHFYGHSIFNYGTLYLGLLEILNTDDHRMHLQLASSRDLVHWNRMSAPQPFLSHGKLDEWDAGILMMGGTAPVRHEDRLWFWYSAAQWDHGPKDRLKRGPRSIGLARLPVDRFAAIQPDDRSRDGTLTTVRLELRGEAIRVNADAGQGTVKFELLDASGDVVPGFGRDDCKGLIREDSLDHPVRWKTAKPLPEQPVRIRFVLTNAKLFSFRVE